ncbi:MAG: hypothetical protein FWE09_07005, partial [Treponema sp.]|nr:hypothetical protein [Treponema sp.]
EIEGIPLRIATAHGAPGFDSPGAEAIVAAKMAARLGPEKFPPGRVVLHEAGQGFFQCWLVDVLRGRIGRADFPVVLSGRNALALEAARHNLWEAGRAVDVIPAADLEPLRALFPGDCAVVAAFPGLVPQSSLPKGSDQMASFWDDARELLSPGGILLVAFGSSEAELFDRRKPAGFARLGTLRRDGRRALAYRRAGQSAEGALASEFEGGLSPPSNSTH